MRRLRLITLLIAAAVAATILQYLAASLMIFSIRMESRIVAKPWRSPVMIYGRAGPDAEPVAEVYGPEWRRGTPVRLGSLPNHVASAFVAAEDVRFHAHFGIDPVAIARAAWTNLRSGGIVQGGSTINQQLVKNALLTHERTIRRKVLEAVLAMALDRRLSKDEILEGYLNEVYLGHVGGKAVLGIDEGSVVYFDKRPEDLTPAEAALLASIIRAPNRDTPEKRPELVRARRDAVLSIMESRGWLEPGVAETARASKARFRRGSRPSEEFRWYLSALRREVADELGDDALRRPGLRIVAEIDPDLQRSAERAARASIRRLERNYSWIRKQSSVDPLQVAILTVDPSTGGVRALVGGRERGWSAFDRTSQMRRQPGSAFKTFVFLAAIGSRNVTPATLLLDAPLTVELGDERWEPLNYDERFRGRVTVREAFEKSLNVPTVRLAEDVGSRRVIRLARDSGLERQRDVPAMSLGVSEVTLFELTSAYTIFPNLGRRAEPYLLRSVHAEDGRELYRRDPSLSRVTDEATAYVMHSLLRGVVRRGTANRLRRYGLGHAAGKTGTTNDYRDAWFVGYTAGQVTTVWLGFDRGAPLRLSSAEAALPLWGSYLSKHASRLDVEVPEGVQEKAIDPETGFVWRSGCPGPFEEVFLEGTAPTRKCPRGWAGRIARKALFDAESFDEPAAITFDKFRRWAHEIDQGRQKWEDRLDRLRDFLRDPFD